MLSKAPITKEKDSNGGKIHTGPIWDFNFAFGLVDYCEGYLPTGYMFSGVVFRNQSCVIGKICLYPSVCQCGQLSLGRVESYRMAQGQHKRLYCCQQNTPE